MRLDVVTVLATLAPVSSYDLDHHQQIDPQDRRAVINVEPSIACPCPAVTAELQPVFFTQYVPKTTVIYPFPGADPLHITRAPTYISLTSTVTQIITSCPVSAPTSVSSATPTPVASSTSSISTATNPLFIGQGLPQGSVNNLDDANFIFLAYRNARTPGPIAKRGYENIRRQATYSTSPVSAVNLAQPTDTSGAIGQDDCDNATPLLLREGRLVHYNNAVAKQLAEDPAILGLLSPQPINEVNTTFDLLDGRLRWLAADFQTNAAFYICGDLIYATWGGPMVPSCTPIVLGAIAGSACVQRVQQTRAPNPAFVAPIPSSTTTVSASSSLSESSQSSSLGISTSSASSGASSSFIIASTLSTVSSPSSSQSASAQSPPTSAVSTSASSTVASVSTTSVSTIVSSRSSIGLTSQSSVNTTPSSSPSVVSSSSTSTSTSLVTSSSAATSILSSSTAASSTSAISTATSPSSSSSSSTGLSNSSSFTTIPSTSAGTTSPSTSTTNTETTTTSSTTQSPTASNPCLKGTYYLFSTAFGKFATPNPAASFTYTLFDGTDSSNALMVAFVYNATINSCQLNIAGSDRTVGIQTGNPNPQAALFLFIDNTRLGDMSQTDGNYYPITCTVDASLQLSCFVTMYPNLNSLQVQGNTSPQNYLAIVPDQSFNNYTPANVILVPV